MRESETGQGTQDAGQVASSWPAWAKALASLLIGFHLLAVLMAPLTMFAPSEALTVPVRNAVAPYQHATYLDHGYQFFAPDPGPSHFVQYIVITQDGERIEGRFPDRDKHWPRLHYHRWFMLSERVYAINDQIMSDEELKAAYADIDRAIREADMNRNVEAVQYFNREKRLLMENNDRLREQSNRLTVAIQNDLAKRYDVRSVQLFAVERTLPRPYQVTTEKRKLTDPEFLPLERRIELKEVEEKKNDAEEIQ